MVYRVPDPATDVDVGCVDAATTIWCTDKYPDGSSPIRMVSWNEVQLIIAEDELGQSAIDRIDAVRAKYGLSEFNPVDPNDSEAIIAQVIEERRREFFAEGHHLNEVPRHGLP